MATIQSTIGLYDSFSPVLYNVMDAVNLTIASVGQMKNALNADVDMVSLDNAMDSIHQAGAAMAALNEQLENHSNVNINMPTPQPIQVPVHWEVDNMEVFTNTGVERFQQEVQSANAMLNALNQTQAQITATAGNMDILPPQASIDMMNMQNRMQAIQQRIMEISNNPVNLGAEQANAELERMRRGLCEAIEEQNRLNAAVNNMDVTGANRAYLNLSSTVSNMEQYLRDNTTEQGRFNQAVQSGTTASNGLLSTIKKIAGTYVSIQAVDKVLNISDELAQTTSRLSMMNDSFNQINGTAYETTELVDLVYAAAQDARGSFSNMAAVVAKFGNNARDAFGSSEEVVAFANLVQKQMTIAGASTVEASNAMLQLSQALASGVLRGDELNSIFEQAPNLIQSIADYMEVPIGQIREMAKEGEITADIVKTSVFAAADDINAKFEEMPMTFGQIWNSISNRALRAFQPFLQQLNDIANNERFNSMVEGAVGALAVLGAVATEVIDLMVSGAAFVHDNWSFIGPLFYGIAFAVGVYTAAVTFNNIALKANNTLSRIAAIRSQAHGIAVTHEMLSTMGMTRAQLELNAAMYASPITWILIGIFAIIAAIYIVTAVINKVCDTSISATGMIVGLIFYIAAALTNFGLLCQNVFFACCEAGKAIAENIYIAFNNSIEKTKGIFYGLASVALKVISVIAEKLSDLPFVTFDAAGLSVAAGKYASIYANKSAEAFGNIKEYNDVLAAWDKGYGTYGLEDFLDPDEEFERGYEWVQKMKEKLSPQGDDENDKSKDYTDLLKSLEGINNNTGATTAGIGETTADIADALDITSEDLKYLRDIAEREVIDRTVLKSVTIDMSGMTNKVENMQDLDGIGAYLAKSLRQQMEVSMEGA